MDAIVEVDSSGTIVWEWSFFDHVIQDYDAAKPNYVGAGKTIADYPGKLDINLDGHNLKNDWLHCNSLDYNQTLDQIVDQLGAGRVLRHRPRRHVRRRRPDRQHRLGRHQRGRFPVPLRRPGPLRPGQQAGDPRGLDALDHRHQADRRRPRHPVDRRRAWTGPGIS